ncbi:MAG: hypothetical protein WA584_09515 [Pyrinomonadaceae bacterium]
MIEYFRKPIIACLALILTAVIVGLALAMDLYYRFPFYWTIPLSAIVTNLALVAAYLYGKTFRRVSSGLASSLTNPFGAFKEPAFSGVGGASSGSFVNGIYRPLPMEVAEAWSKVHSVVWLNSGK